MSVAAHPAFSAQQLTIGRERAPLLVLDNVVAKPEELIELAASKLFGDVTSHYPGVRAKGPLSYQQFVLEKFGGLLAQTFGSPGQKYRFTLCSFSLVTTRPEKLNHLQRIPHIDAALGSQLACVHYLFKANHGGTAFYRHRKTGFEYIDEERRERYFRLVEEEKSGPDKPAVAYINGSTALYEQVGVQDGVFNRMLVYRRNSLHSACIRSDFAFDADPRTGRLSLNGFLA